MRAEEGQGDDRGERGEEARNGGGRKVGGVNNLATQLPSCALYPLCISLPVSLRAHGL